MQGDRERALEAGMDDYISKPVALDRLADVLRRWVEGKDESHDAPGEEDPRSAVDAIDRARIADLRSLQQPGEPDILAELIGPFLQEARSQLAALRAAVAGRDANALKQVAHALKGSASNLAAPRLAALCAELEALPPSRDQVLAEQALSHVESEFERVRAAFQAELEASAGD